MVLDTSLSRSTLKLSLAENQSKMFLLVFLISFSSFFVSLPLILNLNPTFHHWHLQIHLLQSLLRLLGASSRSQSLVLSSFSTSCLTRQSSSCLPSLSWGWSSSSCMERISPQLVSFSNLLFFSFLFFSGFLGSSTNFLFLSTLQYGDGAAVELRLRIQNLLPSLLNPNSLWYLSS